MLFDWAGWPAWNSPCGLNRPALIAQAKAQAAEAGQGQGDVAKQVLRSMLEHDRLNEGQREDLMFVLATIEDLILELKSTGKLAEETAKKNIGNKQQDLDEGTQKWLMSFAMRGQKTVTLRSVAKGVRFAVRAKKMMASGDSVKEGLQQIITFDASVRKGLETLSTWKSFDIFTFDRVTDGHPLQCIGLAVLGRRGLLNTFGLSPSKLASFLREMEITYLDNPYHNSMHAADVVQAMHYILLDTQFTELELLAALLAAICHDAGHPGTTNDFRVLSGDDCAITYNDRSVNENMHCALTYRLLSRADCNFLEGLTVEQRRLIRRIVIRMVLATDMVSHFAELEKFQAALAASGPEPTRWENSDQALCVVLHAADISNACRPTAIVRKWTDRILEEFFAQGDRERKLGRAVSPLCDRVTVSKCDSQLGFINVIVRPIYEALSVVFQVAEPRRHLEATAAMWAEENNRTKNLRRSRRPGPEEGL